MKSETTSKLSLTEAVERALQRHREQNDRLEKMEDIGISIQSQALGDFLDTVLDFLGVPPENHPKEGEKWIKGKHSCRDCYSMLYDIMFCKHKDTEGFIKVVQGLDRLKFGGGTTEEWENFLYPTKVTK
jgi:hypothetical protein